MTTEPPEHPVATVASVHQPVMGTLLEVQIAAGDEAIARAAEAFVVEQATDLERRLTVFDARSDLRRWCAGEVTEPGDELVDLLALAHRWQRRSGGAFNPAVEAITRRWRRAEAEGAPPTAAELAELVASVAVPRFAVEGRVVRVLGDLAEVNLNALAKGYVVDVVAARTLARFELAALTLSAGGDLLHRGAGSLRVAVEDPHRPYDNVAPVDEVRITNAAVATSGRSRRWFDVGGRRFSQVLDPRTGRPVDHVASVTVVAPDVATSDVVATVLSVLPPDEADAFADALAADPVDPVQVAWMSVDDGGDVRVNDAWRLLRTGA